MTLFFLLAGMLIALGLSVLAGFITECIADTVRRDG